MCLYFQLKLFVLFKQEIKSITSNRLANTSLHQAVHKNMHTNTNLHIVRRGSLMDKVSTESIPHQSFKLLSLDTMKMIFSNNQYLSSFMSVSCTHILSLAMRSAASGMGVG